LTAAQTAALAQVAERRNLVRLARHGEIVAHRAPPVLTIGRAEVVLPPGAFLQATTAAEAILARLVASHCRGAARVVDLFCGVGPFALRLAERAHVTAIDSDADALAALRRGAAGSAGLGRSRRSSVICFGILWGGPNSKRSRQSCSIRRGRVHKRKRASLQHPALRK